MHTQWMNNNTIWLWLSTGRDGLQTNYPTTGQRCLLLARHLAWVAKHVQLQGQPSVFHCRVDCLCLEEKHQCSPSKQTTYQTKSKGCGKTFIRHAWNLQLTLQLIHILLRSTDFIREAPRLTCLDLLSMHSAHISILIHIDPLDWHSTTTSSRQNTVSDLVIVHLHYAEFAIMLSAPRRRFPEEMHVMLTTNTWSYQRRMKDCKPLNYCQAD